ncbi:GNAT family N-acetyltransferase [Paenibacillus ihuae]|uniref:GNAT family N-acetyltransferase n=1 Tax=Paenibacillus ihuae TaxID=1232431 RepID=UPI0024730FD6|nr:GNAT family N-acetyltransferase [Paenibacillus ihuae]
MIETDRLKLRSFTLQDAGSMYMNWINDPEIQRNYGEPVYESIALVEELLQKWILFYAREDFYRWAVILKDMETCIGQIAFYHVDSEHHQADIEYCIGQAFQNEGYASETLRAVIQYIFAHTRLHRLQAYHRGRNTVSGMVLKKANMKYEGTLKESFYYSDTGEYDDKHYYGIVKGSVE